MGERAKKTLDYWRKRKNKPQYRIQGQNPSPESLPQKQSEQSPQNNQQGEDLLNPFQLNRK